MGILTCTPSKTTSFVSHQVDSCEGLRYKDSFACLSAFLNFSGLMWDVKGIEKSRKTHKFLARATT